jgi:hypothetical protein
MAAWWGDAGPVLTLQDATSGLLTYSRCNETEVPVSGAATSNTFETQFQPQNSTAIAAIPLIDDTGSASRISIFYLDVHSHLIQSGYTCDSTTGIYHLIGSQIINATGMPALNVETKLAAVQPNNGGGLQLMYHTTDNSTAALYSDASGASWQYTGGAVSQDPYVLPNTISTSRGSGGADIWLVTATDDGNVEVALLSMDQLIWWISTFPSGLQSNNITQASPPSAFTEAKSNGTQGTTTSGYSQQLLHWPAALASPNLAIAHLPYEGAQYIFYVGDDSTLHGVSVEAIVSTGGDGTTSLEPSSWSMLQDQDLSIWPAAIEPGADIATAYDIGTNGSDVRVYYTGPDGSVVEAAYHEGDWLPARVVVPPPGPSSTGSPSYPNTGNGTTPNHAGDNTSDASKLSPGYLAGVVIGSICGVLLGCLALAFMGFRAWRWWDERRRDPLRGMRVNTARARAQARQLYFPNARPYGESGSPRRSMETVQTLQTFTCKFP